MRVFVIGAGGFLGSRVAGAVKAAGHEVSGLVRNDAAAGALTAAGIAPVRGDLAKIGDLAEAVRGADATIYCAQLMMPEERAALDALADMLRGHENTLISTSGTGVLGQRTYGDWSEDAFTEDDPFTPSKTLAPRVETEWAVRRANGGGLRTMVVRPPLIWGYGGSRTIGNFYLSAAKTGAVCYLGRGLNLYSNVQVDDLARLYALALERGVGGALYHAVAGELNFRSMAEAVARVLNLKTRSVTMDEAIELWGKYYTVISLSISSRSRAPRACKDLGWAPTQLDILDDIVSPIYAARYYAPAGDSHARS
jgi:nucleoside-diphosphate-sugar epimerase